MGLMGLCERCKKAQATFHLTNLEASGDKVELHLCERCAQEEGHLQVKPNVNINDLLDSFVSSSKSTGGSYGSLICDECGISYVEFRNQGLLGCAKDYEVFKEPLLRLLDRAHDGATHHTGKIPSSLGMPRTTLQDINRLKRQLTEALAAEDYERAAELRDRVRGLENP